MTESSGLNLARYEIQRLQQRFSSSQVSSLDQYKRLAAAAAVTGLPTEEIEAQLKALLQLVLDYRNGSEQADLDEIRRVVDGLAEDLQMAYWRSLP